MVHSGDLGESAMQNDQREPSRDGTGVISLQNEFLSVSILPGAGGNISEITDRRTGRNWLWSNPHIPFSDHRSADNYNRELDSGGWDEILLSISPDVVLLENKQRLQIPDHGDLIRQNWSASDSKDAAMSCHMQVSGQSPGYDFSRHIALVDNEPRMSVRYSFKNNEDFPLPWYWCAHALIAVEPGMRIELPAAQPYLVEDSTGKLNPAERTRHWPDLNVTEDNSVDLSDCFPERGQGIAFARKIFVEAPEDGAVSVTIPNSAERLTMRFDRELIPWLGLWINNNGWSGCGSEPYLNLGVEPGTTPYDSVARAIENGAIDWIQPGEVRDWSLIVDLAA